MAAILSPPQGVKWKQNFESLESENSFGGIAHVGTVIFRYVFLDEKFLYLDKKFIEVRSQGSNWQHPCNSADNGLAPNRRQGFIWTNNDPIRLRIYGEDDLSMLYVYT